MSKGLLFFCIVSLATFGQAATLLPDEALQNLKNNLMQMQASNGSWDGGLEADPSIEAFVLMFGEKFHIFQNNMALKTRVLNRIWASRNSNGLWGQFPGDSDVSVTGTVLLSLRQTHIASSSDPRVQQAWQWFEQNGGIKSLGPCHKLLLVALGAVSRTELPFLSTQLFSLPLYSPVNIYNMGVYRSIVIPLIVWDFYNQSNSSGVLPLDPARIQSNGSHFTHGCVDIPFLPSNLISTGLCGSEYWAQEGIGWLLGHQQTDGHWYVLQSTMMSVLALQQAQQAGAGDFSNAIQKGILAILNFEKKEADFSYFQISSSSIWDTARILTALGEKFESATAIEFLLNTQALKRGEWSILAPEVSPGGWSFSESQEHYYPDTDTAAAVIDALLTHEKFRNDPKIQKSVKTGLQWLLGMQNSDGGFPAWDRNASSSFANLLSVTMGQTVEISDLSQSDVSARILKLLSKLKRYPEYAQLISQRALQNICQYLVHRGPPWRGDWWNNYIYATAEVSEALYTAGCRSNTASQNDIAWILQYQNSDGGWGEKIDSYRSGRVVVGPSTLSQTDFVLRALLAFKKSGLKVAGLNSAIDKGVEFLLSKIEKDPSLQSYQEFTGVFVKNAMYANYRLLPYYETARVLRTYVEQDHQ